ncbi:aminopeptidase [Azotosporobacter soli]|uniref:aminopeptidase n=1 Tax=Azotosporobacter soli TaxID=3055040 RepID=UPI0031FEF9C8
MEQELMKKYARLIVKTGVNVQKDQTLIIVSPIECAPFARAMAEVAYQTGARDVVISWRDELFAKLRYQMGPDEIFDEFPAWQKDMFVNLTRQGAGVISIAASDPELLKDVDPDRVARAMKASTSALKEYRERMMAHRNTWCVVSMPTKAWAAKVFPQLDEEAALEKLWQAIYQAVRVNEADPVAAWQQHQAKLQAAMDFMNGHTFRYLKYKNGLGTDLTIELPKEHLWLGGSERTPGGVDFFANMPTEEIFTLPLKSGINGTVYSSKPLNYHGNLIDRFCLTFEAGRVVSFSAEQGYEVLKNLLETDEGASFIGEVALVPFDSPISNSGILFYNTLFDENASCHLAFGKAYPICIKGGEGLSPEELAERGVNDSLVHEDFMVGTADLSITGITADGTEVPVFRQGNFAF